jgi:leader peptidase (prepilin peptidase)/N-methyltransferase
MIYLWLPVVFVLGAAVGSFINVCVYRLPYERSLFWPGSRCGKCYQAIRWYDNLPLISYWALRGRCRVCGARFSPRYFLVELFTGLGFAGLFYLIIIRNILHIRMISDEYEWLIAWGRSWRAWAVFGYHALLFSFLLVVSLCDLDDMEIPLSVTMTGTLVGLVGATVFAWPFPNDEHRVTAAPPPLHAAHLGVQRPEPGLYAWPVWYPLPPSLPAGSWKLGLLTGLVGAAAGMAVLRGVRFVFSWGRGIEGLGLGDADLMMMAGAFIGWQPVVTAFFVATGPALVFALVQVLRRGDRPMPFGPSLAAGVLLTVLLWPSLGGPLWIYFSEPLVLLFVGGVGTFLLLAMALLLRLFRGVPADAAGAD